MPEFDGLSTDHAAHWRVEFRVAEIELSGVQAGAGLLQVSGSRIRTGNRCTTFT